MRIGIDTSSLQGGGGNQVAISFINDLIRINGPEKYVIIMSPQISHSLKKIKLPNNFQFVEISKNYYKNIYIRGRELRKLEDEYKLTLIFTIFGPSYHKSKCPKVVGFAVGQMLYPDSPYFSKINFLSKVKIKFLLKLKKFFFIKNSDVLIFETDDSRRIFTNMIEGKIKSFTVSNTLNEIFYHPQKWCDKNFNITSSFNILFLTANYPHKNLDIIPDIIDYILSNTSIRDFKFILSVTKDELGFLTKYDDYIEYIGEVRLEEVPTLYKQVDMLFMPSLLEIFSTSYLEAMYMKKPILASDLSFARDICADAAIYCSPLDSAEYANGIIKLYNNQELRNDLQNKGTINLKRFGTSMQRTESYLKILRNYNSYGNYK